ncbi:S9 family peptidase [soil metagenome]
MLRFGLAAMFAAALGLSSVPAAAASPPPVSAYGRLPSTAQVVISPDGTRVAYVSGVDAGQQLHVVNLADMTPITVQDVNGWKIRSLGWAGTDHVLVTVSSATTLGRNFLARVGEWSQLVEFDIPAKTFKQLMVDFRGLPHETLNVIASDPQGLVQNGRPVVYVEGIIIPEQKAQIALFRIDLTTGVVSQLGETTSKVRHWMLDGAGAPVARSLYDDETGRYSLELAKGGGWRSVYSVAAPLDRPYIAGIGRKSSSVLLRVFADDAWSTYDVDGEAAGLGAALDGFGEGSIVLEPASGKPSGVVSAGVDGLHYRFFEPSDQKRWGSVVRAFKGETVQLVSWSDDRTKVAVLVSGPVNGAAYYVVNMTKHTAEFLGDRYAQLPAEVYNEQKPVTYAAQDGTPIPALLTLPRGRDPHGLPLVVLPHGGPASQDTPGFDWWSQAIASRGYAVLQPQFRGSEGFGAKFLSAGYGEWGRKMQTDVSDGVVELAKQGVIDPKRVCIAGASYGGYAALAGVTLQQGIYRCAVAVSGPANLKELIDEDTRYSGSRRSTSSNRYWARFMGAKSSSDPSLATISPALHADKASVPVLLIHGKDDTVVPYAQSQEMEAALKKAGKPVEFVTLDHEDHWLSQADTRVKMLTETLRFLNANNPPDAPAKQTAAAY